MQNFDYENKNIAKNEFWFNLFIKLPVILLVFNALGVFALGIALGVIFKSAGTVFLCWLIGAVGICLIYVMLKILMSPTILKTCYLEEIHFGIRNLERIEKKKITEKKVIKVEEKEKRTKAWVCPKCKELNNALSKNCINCFEPRP